MTTSLFRSVTVSAMLASALAACAGEVNHSDSRNLVVDPASPISEDLLNGRVPEEPKGEASAQDLPAAQSQAQTPSEALASPAASPGSESLVGSGDVHFSTSVSITVVQPSPEPATPAPSASPTASNSTINIYVRGRDKKECGLRPFVQTYKIRPLKAAEKKALGELPYRSTLKHKDPKFRHGIRTLNAGQMTQLVGKTPVVLDSQVLFAVDVTGLPVESRIVSRQSPQLTLNVTKVSGDNFMGTEMLCFMNEKICSGETFEAKTWKENINPKYFGESVPLNREFSNQMLDHQVASLGKSKRVFAGELGIDLDEAFAGSSIRDSVSYLSEKASGKNKFTLYFTVADDTYVSLNGGLRIELVEDTCKSGQ